MKTRNAGLTPFLEQLVIPAAILFGSILLLSGCTLIEGVGRALNIVADIAEAPAQIDIFSVVPQEVELYFGCNIFTSELVRADWSVIGKRIKLLLDGTTVFEQSTSEVRDIINGQTDVQIDPSSIGIVRLVAYNAVDQAVAQAITVSITTVPVGPPCSPPCTPGVDC